jgi:succinate-acetate transporter protein
MTDQTTALTTSGSSSAPDSLHRREGLIFLRPVGSPLALGFLALSVASFVFACVQLEWIAASNGSDVARAVLVLTVPLQLIVAVVAFVGRDTAVGTAMGLLAGTWAAASIVSMDLPPGGTSQALGVVLLAAGACLLAPALAAAHAPLPASVIAASALRFIVTGVAETTGSTDWLHAAGWVGIALSALSFVVAMVVITDRVGADLAEQPGVRPGV